MTFPMYRRLIKLYARAFYDGEILGSAQGEKPKKGKSSRGLAVVVLDTLMRRQWIKEEELAKDLQLHSKQVKKVVKILQDEGIVVRDSRKEVGFAYLLTIIQVYLCILLFFV
jgi:transcription initiation factor TFIIE subunit alpha